MFSAMKKTSAIATLLLMSISSLTAEHTVATTMKTSNLRARDLAGVGSVTRPPNRPAVGSVTRPPAIPERTGPTPSTFRLETNINMTYFSGQPSDVDRNLTGAELAQLQFTIGEFYTDLFSADLILAKDFQSFQASFPLPPIYTAGAIVGSGTPPSLVIPFESTITFAPELAGINVNDLLLKMQNADYQAFIITYLYKDDNSIDNQLNNVQQVEFDGESLP